MRDLLKMPRLVNSRNVLRKSFDLPYIPTHLIQSKIYTTTVGMASLILGDVIEAKISLRSYKKDFIF